MSSFDYSIKEKYKLIAWPTPQDYQEGIQVPSATLSDETLKTGETELNALGLPRPRTGNFACVYRIKCANRDFAVRFFLNNITDQDERYRALSHSITGDDLEYTVDFEYEPKGIRIHGNWYPALKMLWVEGEPLDQYVSRNHQSQESMLVLLAQFATMVKCLQNNGIAHGDLQHGNILVTNDGLRLVDYDGMFVPALSGHGSAELGHRNYQHPARNRDHFGAYLDNFSAWVIYTALEAVTIDPSVWELLKGGDECLLFRGADFKEPGESTAFALLLGHPSEVIRESAAKLQSFLKLDPSDVPFLKLDEDTKELIKSERSKHYHEKKWYEQPGSVFEEKREKPPFTWSEKREKPPFTWSEKKDEHSLLVQIFWEVFDYFFGIGKPGWTTRRLAYLLLIIFLLVGLTSAVGNHFSSVPPERAVQSDVQTVQSLPRTFTLSVGTGETQQWNRPRPDVPVYLITSENGSSVALLKKANAQFEAFQYTYDGPFKGLSLDFPSGRCNFGSQTTNFVNVSEPGGSRYHVAWNRTDVRPNNTDIRSIIVSDFNASRTSANAEFEPSPMAKSPPAMVPRMTTELRQLATEAMGASRYEDALVCLYATYKLENSAKLPNSDSVLLECLTQMRICAQNLNDEKLLAQVSYRALVYYHRRASDLVLVSFHDSRSCAELESIGKQIVLLYKDSYTIAESTVALKSIDSILSVLAQTNLKSGVDGWSTAFEALWRYTAGTAIGQLTNYGNITCRAAGEALLGQLKRSYSKAPASSQVKCLKMLQPFKNQSNVMRNFVRFLESTPPAATPNSN